MRRGSPCRGAPCAVVSPCRCLVTPVVRPSRQCPMSVLLNCPGCGSTRWRLAGGACGRRPAVGRRYWPGVPGRRPCRPSPAPRPPVGCPPVRFPRPGSGRPTVRCPAVRCPAVRCPVSWFRRPGSNRPAGWCPSARSPSRRWQPGGGRGDHVGGRATLRPGRIGLQVVCGSRAAWSTAPVGLEGAMLWWSAGGGAAVADLAGSGSGAGCDRARPLVGGEASLA